MRVIHQIQGADARSFLQGLITNDVDKAADGLVYAAILTPQGKYLADFFVFEKDGVLHIDAAQEIAPSLIQRLNMYRLRADVQITPIDLEVRRGTGPAPAGALADPRHPALGWRLYGADGGDDGTDWDAIRVAHCIPETGIELTPDTFILEAGFGRLNGVDFEKGCYVGQEVTARMKHKTELRKGLATVSITGTAPPGTPITAEEKPVGTLFTSAGAQAIAHLRFDRTAGPLKAGEARLSYPAD